MRVHGDAGVLIMWHEIVPVAQRLERIMDEGHYVALLASGIP